MFEPTSRYYRLKDARYTAPNGAHVIYKRRRFLPRGEAMPSPLTARVFAGDRLDLIAARTLGDPQQFWRICDANDAMNPFDLVARPGSTLRIPNPQAGAG